MSIQDSIQPFSAWLETTPVSTTIQSVSWIIPAVQTIHILAISVVMGAIVLVDLRLLGIAMRSQPANEVANRTLPHVWYALIVLFISGAILITGEPGRSLSNPAFLLKMALLVVTLIITALLQRSASSNSNFWQLAPNQRIIPGVVAGISLSLWIAIIFSGRWIAYTGI
jgi:hypothetical protein